MYETPGTQLGGEHKPADTRADVREPPTSYVGERIDGTGHQLYQPKHASSCASTRRQLRPERSPAIELSGMHAPLSRLHTIRYTDRREFAP